MSANPLTESPNMVNIRTTRTQWLQSLSYYGAFIGLGFSGAILGPTLSQLAAHTETSLGMISWLVSANAFGRLFGGLFGGRLFDRLPGHPTVGGALLLMAIALALVPIAPLLAVLFILEALLGLAEGTVDVGCNTLLLWVHGNKVGPFMNALHFMFGVGSLITPFILVYSLTNTGDVQQAYWIVAAAMLPLALFVLTQRSPHAQNTAPVLPHIPQAVRANSPLLIGLIALFFYLIVAGEGSMFSWLFNVGKSLAMSDAQAGQLSQVFFGLFTIGRLVSIPLATRLSPSRMLLINTIGSLIASILMGFGFGAPILIWVSTGLYGLCIAPLFAATLSFAEQHIKITGRVTGIFLAAANLGIMTVPPIIGQFYESAGPITVPIAIGSTIALALATFIAILLRVNQQTRHT